MFQLFKTCNYHPMGSHQRFWVQTYWCAGEKPCWPSATKLDLWLPTSSWLGGPLCSQIKKKKEKEVITLNSMKTLLLTPIPKGRWIYKSYHLYRLFTFHQFFNSYQAKINSIILFHLFQFQNLFTHQNKQTEQNWFQINQHQI